MPPASGGPCAMPDNDLQEKLCETCGQLLPPPVPDPLVRQIVRILLAKLDAREIERIEDPADLFRAFVSLRLLSPRLLFLFGRPPDQDKEGPFATLEMPWISTSMAGLLERVTAEMASAAAATAGQLSWNSTSLAQGLAVCFAASAYPQRVSQMINTTLAWRVEAWLNEFLRLREPGAKLLAVGGLPRSIEADTFLSVLGGANHNEPDWMLRRNGAALYFASCYGDRNRDRDQDQDQDQDEIDRIVKTWRIEAPFVNFLRKWLETWKSVV